MLLSSLSSLLRLPLMSPTQLPHIISFSPLSPSLPLSSWSSFSSSPHILLLTIITILFLSSSLPLSLPCLLVSSFLLESPCLPSFLPLSLTSSSDAHVFSLFFPGLVSFDYHLSMPHVIFQLSASPSSFCSISSPLFYPSRPLIFPIHVIPLGCRYTPTLTFVLCSHLYIYPMYY